MTWYPKKTETAIVTKKEWDRINRPIPEEELKEMLEKIKQEQLDGCPCPKHKKYKAILKPRVNCEFCWRRYFIKHGLNKKWG